MEDDVEKGDVKVIEGRKDDGEEVTSPIKEMQLSEKTPGVMRTGCFQRRWAMSIVRGT